MLNILEKQVCTYTNQPKNVINLDAKSRNRAIIIKIAITCGSKSKFSQLESPCHLGREISSGALLESQEDTNVTVSLNLLNLPSTPGKTTSSVGETTRLILVFAST